MSRYHYSPSYPINCSGWLSADDITLCFDHRGLLCITGYSDDAFTVSLLEVRP